MVRSDQATDRISRQLADGNVGLAIMEMEVFLSAWPHPQTALKLQAVKEDYGRMAAYWKEGGRDPQRDAVYGRLLQQVYVLFANVATHRRIQQSSFLSTLFRESRQPALEWSVASVRSEMEDYVSNMALLQLEPDHLRSTKQKELCRQHQQRMNQLFNYVLTSRMWTDGVGRDFTELLLSPTVDTVDQQLLVSAVMLSLMCQFDLVKFRLLADVYMRSDDEHVRQRALVGWVFGMEPYWEAVYPEQRDIIARMVASDQVCAELAELQQQLLYTLNAETDTTTIQQEIMPDLLKNQSFRITRQGIEEIDDDPLEDVLHPDAAEERMEKVEASLRRMMDMQKSGADIYFGGFSQMKRFPFFYDVANWLVPFYMSHPDISQYVEKVGTNRFLQTLMAKGPFCDSDKYSFVMAFQQVVDRLPQSLQQMMERGEAAMDIAGMEPDHPETRSAVFIRRIYLMDLYRFFRLFPNRQAMPNPFDTDWATDCGAGFMASPLLQGTPVDDLKHRVMRVMRKTGSERMREQLLDSIPQRLWDVQYYLWRGDYDAVLLLEPDNERALAARARRLFEQQHYDAANDDYSRLLLLHPAKAGYMLNKAVCLVRLEEYGDAQRLLYQLHYEHADDENVLRVLAWALTCDGKLEQAARFYEQLMGGVHPSAEDHLNYAYCLWLQGHIGEAVGHLARYVEMEGHSDEVLRSAFDADWLQARGIADIDIRMMQALVGGR
jgi:hypothetical protein